MTDTNWAMLGRLVLVLMILPVVLFWALPIAAQYTTASLSGTVVDPSGAAVPGAKVTVQNAGTGFTRITASGNDGDYLFPVLPVGQYTLTVVKSGFQTYAQKGIILTVNRAATQLVTLKLGTQTQEVTVNGNASLVTTTSAAVGQLVNQKDTVDLPLNGRATETLVFLVPGANNVTNNYCGAGCEGGVYPTEQYADVNGGGPNGVNYQLDGADNNDTYMNTNLPFPDPDAVQEFNVQTGNMSAEYGNAESGVVNIVTKSGTNQFHGDAFDFVRNYIFDSRNFFAPTRDTLKQNQFGGTLGGPIKKDKLFFFGSYQGTRTRTAPNGEIAVVPTAAERGGDFSALCGQFDSSGNCTNPSGIQLSNPFTGATLPYNQIPSSMISQPSLNLLKYVPPPNSPSGILNYLGAATNTDDDQFLSKIDYLFGKHHVSGRYFFTNFNEPATPLGTNILALNANANRVRVQTISLNDDYTVSAHLLLNTWFGWNQQNGGYIASTPFSANALGVNIAPSPSPQIDITIGGYFSALSANVGAYNRGDMTLREVATAVLGKHQIAFGGEMLRVRAPIANQYQQGGIFDFTDSLSGDNLADLMLGATTQFVQAGGIYGNITGTKWSAFIQDDWRATSRLTLSGGMRWDPYFPYTDSEGRLPCFEPGKQSKRYPNAPLGLLFANDAGCPAGTVYSNLSNFAPRIGFAYRLTSDAKTSLRGGAGYYYQPPETLAFQDDVGVAPFAPIYTLNVVNFANPFGSEGMANPFPAEFGPKLPPSSATFPLPTTVGYFFARGFHLPEVTIWNLTLERQVGKTWLFTIAYVGNKATHLYGTSDQEPMADINAAVYVPGNSTEANTQQRRPYTNFGPMGMIDSGFNSNYHALELNAQKYLSHGLSFLANYTWSRNFSDFSESLNMSYYQTDPFNRNFNYGPSESDIPYVFKFSGTWEIPHVHLGSAGDKLLNGWELAPILVWQSGLPYSIMSGLDNSFTGDYSDRADFIGTKISQAKLNPDRPHGQLIQEYFNTALFEPNAIGTFGNSAKNNLRGPGLFNTDLALLKNTKIGEHLTLQFRAEFYNAFNNVAFGLPDFTTTDPTFGQILSTAGSPRIMQFAFKLLF
jgi:hypothetical protein